MAQKLKVRPDEGWVLIARDDSSERLGWYICWQELFTRRRSALKFATDNDWTKGTYRAVRASLAVI